MSRDELRTRVGQEAGKRTDLVRYRLGLRHWVKRPAPLVTAAPRFLFDSNELSSIIRLIRERLPLEAKKIVQEADGICLHSFDLLGYARLDYGSEIDWHFDAVHGKRGPRKPAFKINFLDFETFGDHKVIWELNRHQHLVTLAKAWLLTGESRYVTELAAQWYGWRRANPYPMGINWASSLEAAFRSLAWLWIHELLQACDACAPALTDDLLRGVAVHGRFIERNLSTYFSPNTHLIGEAVALFFIGTLCPQFSAAARWRELGWRIVISEAMRQVRPDGVYFEQSLHYHVYALDFFLHARQLAIRNAVVVPEDFDETVLRMLEVLRALAQASPPEGFGDDDGGRVFNPRRNHTGHLTDPLAAGAGIFARPDFKASAGLTEEAIWLLGPHGVALFDALEDCPPAPEPRSFEAGGVYVMASAPVENPALQMAIDAGPQGCGRCGHGHADALSVRAGIGGKRWLIDPGTCSYIAGAERDWFRGTAAHNTLRVDERDQAEPEGPFAWNAVPNVQVERWQPGITFAFFAGNHTGYTRLPDPVLHRRFVAQISGGGDSLWLVRDLAEGRDTHSLEVFWHFAAETSMKWAGEAFVASGSASAKSSGQPQPAQLTLLGARDAGWTRELSSARVSPAYGLRQEGPLVRFEARLGLPAECATLLLPGAPEAGAVFERVGAGLRAEARAVSAYRYQGGAVKREFLFGETDEAWTFGAWSSDARFLYARFEAGRLAHLVLVDGSFARLDARPVVACAGKVARFERLDLGGEVQTFSSEGEAKGAGTRKNLRQ
jgi:Heparinase II/III-like protein/Heparinase II/III N-terminus